jgi:hypothetical protein
MTTQEPLSKFVALHAEIDPIGLVLSGKIGGDVARILDDRSPVNDPGQTGFAIQRYAAGPGPHPQLWRLLSFDELKQIYAALEAELPHPPPGLDLALFHAFIARVKHELASEPSTRFNPARFSDIVKEQDGVLVARYGLGIDMTGTIHDAHGRISAEQHVVPMHPGKFHRLSRADRLSLAAALTRFIQSAPQPVDPLWRQLEQDAAK